MKRHLSINQNALPVEVHHLDKSRVSFEWAGATHVFEIVSRSDDVLIVKNQNSQQFRLKLTGLGGVTFISGTGLDAEISEGQVGAKKKAAGGGSLNAPMPGKIFKVVTKVGDAVTKGQTLLIMEAMKMEHAIKADKDGVLSKIFFKEGELVQGGMLLAEIK